MLRDHRESQVRARMAAPCPRNDRTMLSELKTRGSNISDGPTDSCVISHHRLVITDLSI